MCKRGVASPPRVRRTSTTSRAIRHEWALKTDREPTKRPRTQADQRGPARRACGTHMAAARTNSAAPIPGVRATLAALRHTPNWPIAVTRRRRESAHDEGSAFSTFGAPMDRFNPPARGHALSEDDGRRAFDPLVDLGDEAELDEVGPSAGSSARLRSNTQVGIPPGPMTRAESGLPAARSSARFRQALQEEGEAIAASVSAPSIQALRTGRTAHASPSPWSTSSMPSERAANTSPSLTRPVGLSAATHVAGTQPSQPWRQHVATSIAVGMALLIGFVGSFTLANALAPGRTRLAFSPQPVRGFLQSGLLQTDVLPNVVQRLTHANAQLRDWTQPPTNAKRVPTPRPSVVRPPHDDAGIVAALARGTLRSYNALLLSHSDSRAITFAAARRVCEEMVVDNVRGFRLPTIGELRSLSEAKLLEPGYHWSGTAADIHGHAHLSYEHGNRRMTGSRARSQVLCVRDIR